MPKDKEPTLADDLLRGADQIAASRLDLIGMATTIGDLRYAGMAAAHVANDYRKMLGERRVAAALAASRVPSSGQEVAADPKSATTALDEMTAFYQQKHGVDAGSLDDKAETAESADLTGTGRISIKLSPTDPVDVKIDQLRELVKAANLAAALIGLGREYQVEFDTGRNGQVPRPLSNGITVKVSKKL